MNSSNPDNANPVIHNTAASSSSKKLKSTAFLDLDFEDDQAWHSLEEELSYGSVDPDYRSVSDGAEHIDREEIFGVSPPSEPVAVSSPLPLSL